MTCPTIIRLVLSALLACCGAAGAADSAPPLTPERYFACQMAARQASLAGMQQRQTLHRKSADATTLDRHGQTSSARVSLAFHQCGHSPAELGAYAHRNREQLKTWLLLNPTMRSRMAEEGRKIHALADQMSTDPRRGAR
jgi:hypothetical protein